MHYPLRAFVVIVVAIVAVVLGRAPRGRVD